MERPAVRFVRFSGKGRRRARRSRLVVASEVGRVFVLDHSRIIRPGLLPRGPSSSNVRAVELRCGSTWQNLTGKARLKSAGARSRVDCTSSRAAIHAVRAYSSIGQSPRLITGLFLVRTQVGPLCCLVAGAPTRDIHRLSAGAPTRARRTCFAADSARARKACFGASSTLARSAGAQGSRLDSEESRFP